MTTRESCFNTTGVIAPEGGRSSIPETLKIEPRSRGVLDRPPPRAMTSQVAAHFALEHQHQIIRRHLGDLDQHQSDTRRQLQNTASNGATLPSCSLGHHAGSDRSIRSSHFAPSTLRAPSRDHLRADNVVPRSHSKMDSRSNLPGCTAPPPSTSKRFSAGQRHRRSNCPSSR
jgi:hypothetical protein